MRRGFSVSLVLPLVVALLGLSLWPSVAGTAQAAVLHRFALSGERPTFTLPRTNASITAVGSNAAADGAQGTTVKGYDCATLLTPAELDAAAGLTGGTVTTNGRGDQPGLGQVPGVTECGIAIPTVSNWSGAFAVFTGDEALQNFNALWAIDQSAGYASLPGVGTEALIQSNAAPGVNAVARGANGIGVQIGVAYDPTSTTEQAVKDAVQQILALVVSRT